MRNKLTVLLTLFWLLGAAAAAQQGVDVEKIKALEAKTQADPDNAALWLQLGQMQLGAARGRDATWLDAAQRSFEQALKRRADDPKATAYLGLTLSAQAGQLFEAGKLAEAQPLIMRGFESLDRAVKAAPADAEVRRLRGELNLQVPEFMGRTDPGVADLEAVVADPSFAKLRAPEQAKIYWLLGTGYARQGKSERAQAVWQKAVAAAPESNAGKDAQKRLNVSAPAGAAKAKAHPERMADIPDNVSPIMAVASVRFKTGADSKATTGLADGSEQMLEAMKRAKGFMGMRLFQSDEKEPMYVIISWWKDRQALVDWYYHPAHQMVVKAFHAGGPGEGAPPQDVITHLGLNFYAPLRPDRSLGEKFGPTQKAVE